MNSFPLKPTVEPPSQSAAAAGPFIPAAITKIEDTGLSPLWLQDLILKSFIIRDTLPVSN